LILNAARSGALEEVMLAGAEGIAAINFNRGEDAVVSGGGQDDRVLHLGIADGAFGFGFKAMNGKRAGSIEISGDKRCLVTVAADTVHHGDAGEIGERHSRTMHGAVAGDIADSGLGG